jgi:hypothetical protein
LLYLDYQSCFFEDFAAKSLIDGLSCLHASAWKVPPVDVAAVREEDAPTFKYQCGDRYTVSR